MAERFELKIISPDEVFYEGEGTFLEFVSVEGENFRRRDGCISEPYSAYNDLRALRYEDPQ